MSINEWHTNTGSCSCNNCYEFRNRGTDKIKKVISIETVGTEIYHESISPWCSCEACYKAKCIKMETTTGTKVEDDGEDGCFINYPFLKYDKHTGGIPMSCNCLDPEDFIEYSDLEEIINKKKLITNSASYDMNKVPNIQVRTFESGATRDQDLNKLDFEGFLSPLVLEEFAKYMHKNRIQSDGSMRSSENWQKGIPKDAYMKSAFRHFHDWWKEHRGYESREGMKDALMGLLFNVMGYTFEILKEEKENE